MANQNSSVNTEENGASVLFNSGESRSEIQQAQTTQLITPAVINNLGLNPVSCFCVVCNTEVVTEVKKKITLKNHLIAGILCIVGGCLCVWIPYVFDCCRKPLHFCPQCKSLLGSGTK